MTCCALIGAALSGCGGDAIEDEEYVGVTQEPIKNGIFVGTAKGVIEITSAAGTCTGALIGRHWAITAAHCIRTSKGDPNANFVGTVHYFDPDTGKRRISYSNETFRAHHVGTWDGPSKFDYQDDLAVFARTRYGWIGTDSSDYLALNASLNLRGLEHFGSGFFSDAGNGAGTLRKRPVAPKDWDKYWFYDLEATRGTCAGDSGGPYINTVNGQRVVTGVHAGSQKEKDDFCARDGGRQYAARVNYRLSWMINTLGLPCRINKATGWAVCNGHEEF